MLRSFSDNTSKKVEETFVIDETETELTEIEYAENSIEESIEE